MRRLHFAKNDLDWLPKQYRYVRSVVIGGTWTVVGGGLLTAMVWGAHFFVFGKGILAVGAAGHALGDRVSKSIVQRRLGKLARGDVDLAKLSNADDGELVHVRGVVRAHEQVPSLLGGAPGVYRRISANFGDVRTIEESAVDFQLVDAEGNAIGIETEGARWVVQETKKTKLTNAEVLASFEGLELVRSFFSRRRDREARKKRLWAAHLVHASETMLRAGDEVEVVGYKSRQVDPTMADRMFRDTPMRATLRAGRDLPLIVSRVKNA
ncbi:MAG: hypothetical protein ABI321_08065 [Polyangia bacterium]